MLNNVASIYGVPISTPVVTGGTLFTSGGFNYRVFTANGTLTVTSGTLTCDVLSVAGGGGGSGGGAGAGGLVYTTSVSVAPNTYTVTVGGGGSGGSGVPMEQKELTQT